MRGILVNLIFRSLARRYPYNPPVTHRDISIELDEGSQAKRIYYVVKFSDGSHWTTLDFPNPYPPQDRAIINFLLDRTAKKLE